MEKKEIIKTFAIQSNKTPVRNNSTSGGTFYELAIRMIEMGTYVCAAGFDSSGRVVHKIVNTRKGLLKLLGSKYVQSDLRDSFRKIKILLNKGYRVLFVGTPCQVMGLKSFLVDEYDSLFTIDLVCFGVPSPKLYESWLNAISINEKKQMIRINFRDKSFGYAAPNVKVYFSDGSSVEQNSLVKSYMKFFMEGLSVRPSCTKCAFKGPQRVSDITLGDCWHIGNFDKRMDDNIGTTAAFVHSTKGMEMLHMIADRVRMRSISTDKEIELDAKKMIISVTENEKRHAFLLDANTLGYFDVLKKWNHSSLKDNAITFVKRVFKNIFFLRIALKWLRK